MSVPNLPVDLSDRARDDLTSIARHTERQWGARQRDIYLDALETTLQAIGANPFLGRARLDLSPDLRSLTIKQHIIFYRIEEDAIVVDRILHVRMDAASNLDI